LISFTFKDPVLGCSPLPLNNPGGSILKFPTFSFLPSKYAYPYFSSISNFSSLNTIESQQAIGRWVENNIGSPVNKTHGIHTIYFNNPQ
jgi:hypothetical protein